MNDILTKRKTIKISLQPFPSSNTFTAGQTINSSKHKTNPFVTTWVNNDRNLKQINSTENRLVRCSSNLSHQVGTIFSHSTTRNEAINYVKRLKSSERSILSKKKSLLIKTTSKLKASCATLIQSLIRGYLFRKHFKYKRQSQSHFSLRQVENIECINYNKIKLHKRDFVYFIRNEYMNKIILRNCENVKNKIIYIQLWYKQYYYAKKNSSYFYNNNNSSFISNSNKGSTRLKEKTIFFNNDKIFDLNSGRNDISSNYDLNTSRSVISRNYNINMSNVNLNKTQLRSTLPNASVITHSSHNNNSSVYGGYNNCGNTLNSNNSFYYDFNNVSQDKENSYLYNNNSINRSLLYDNVNAVTISNNNNNAAPYNHNSYNQSNTNANNNFIQNRIYDKYSYDTNNYNLQRIQTVTIRNKAGNRNVNKVTPRKIAVPKINIKGSNQPYKKELFTKTNISNLRSTTNTVNDYGSSSSLGKNRTSMIYKKRSSSIGSYRKEQSNTNNTNTSTLITNNNSFQCAHMYNANISITNLDINPINAYDDIEFNLGKIYEVSHHKICSHYFIDEIDMKENIIQLHNKSKYDLSSKPSLRNSTNNNVYVNTLNENYITLGCVDGDTYNNNEDLVDVAKKLDFDNITYTNTNSITTSLNTSYNKDKKRTLLSSSTYTHNSNSNNALREVINEETTPYKKNINLKASMNIIKSRKAIEVKLNTPSTFNVDLQTHTTTSKYNTSSDRTNSVYIKKKKRYSIAEDIYNSNNITNDINITTYKGNKETKCRSRDGSPIFEGKDGNRNRKVLINLFKKIDGKSRESLFLDKDDMWKRSRGCSKPSNKKNNENDSEFKHVKKISEINEKETEMVLDNKGSNVGKKPKQNKSDYDNEIIGNEIDIINTNKEICDIKYDNNINTNTIINGPCGTDNNNISFPKCLSNNHQIEHISVYTLSNNEPHNNNDNHLCLFNVNNNNIVPQPLNPKIITVNNTNRIENIPLVYPYCKSIGFIIIPSDDNNIDISKSLRNSFVTSIFDSNKNEISFLNNDSRLSIMKPYNSNKTLLTDIYNSNETNSILQYSLTQNASAMIDNNNNTIYNKKNSSILTTPLKNKSNLNTNSKFNYETSIKKKHSLNNSNNNNNLYRNISNSALKINYPSKDNSHFNKQSPSHLNISQYKSNHCSSLNNTSNKVSSVNDNNTKSVSSFSINNTLQHKISNEQNDSLNNSIDDYIPLTQSPTLQARQEMQIAPTMKTNIGTNNNCPIYKPKYSQLINNTMFIEASRESEITDRTVNTCSTEYKQPPHTFEYETNNIMNSESKQDYIRINDKAVDNSNLNEYDKEINHEEININNVSLSKDKETTNANDNFTTPNKENHNKTSIISSSLTCPQIQVFPKTTNDATMSSFSKSTVKLEMHLQQPEILFDPISNNNLKISSSPYIKPYINTKHWKYFINADPLLTIYKSVLSTHIKFLYTNIILTQLNDKEEYPDVLTQNTIVYRPIKKERPLYNVLPIDIIHKQKILRCTKIYKQTSLTLTESNTPSIKPISQREVIQDNKEDKLNLVNYICNLSMKPRHKYIRKTFKKKF